MLDLPGYPVLDKQALIGGCVRLPIAIDIDVLAQEYRSLPDTLWGTTGGRVGVHNAAQAIFLRGYAPAEGEKPVEDRPALAHLPYVRRIVEQLIPAPALRCLLAKLPAGASIAPHIDRAPYFAKTVRIHIPIESHNNAWMMCADRLYQMRPGECWAINNSAMHAVCNADATRSRTHLICDFIPAASLMALISGGEKDLAIHDGPLPACP
jgi:hypothetical protein